MKKQEELLRQIANKLQAGVDFSSYMYFLDDEPGFNVFSWELESAREYIFSIIDQRQPEFSDKIPKLVELLRTCAEVTGDRHYPFLAGEFDRLATDAADTLQAELEGIEGEANAPL